MRFVVLIAIVGLMATSASAEDLRPSQTSCDAKKIGARELAECLRMNADKADKELVATIEAAAKSIDGRAGRPERRARRTGPAEKPNRHQPDRRPGARQFHQEGR